MSRPKTGPTKVKASVTIDRAIYKAARAKAAKNGEGFSGMVNRLLRESL